MNVQSGALRLFRVFGIDVFLHWSWAIVAIIQIKFRADRYSNLAWPIAEYLTLFGIVLLHEFGHALACRSVGGRAERIMLWPLGGVAYVDPPPRPGAHLWSLAAGPLVNVLLLPATWALFNYRRLIWPHASSDFQLFLYDIALINTVILIFNMLPIYPLDGGQILRSLLWFVIGPIRSLLAAASIGLIGAIAGMIWAFSNNNTWLVIMAFFAASRSWTGLRLARAQGALSRMPRHDLAACPHCKQHPPRGTFWGCHCGNRFDPFASHGVCPNCQRMHPETGCPYCGKRSPIGLWQPAGTYTSYTAPI